MKKGCGGNCGSCGGCGGISLTEPELDLLRELGQIPFLPVARRADSMEPVYLEESPYTPDSCTLILQNLEAKGLIDMDYSCPLKGFDYAEYAGFPVHGTVALTLRGQTVLELLERQGAAK